MSYPSCCCNRNISSIRVGCIYGETMLYNCKVYLQSLISLTRIGVAIQGPMLYACIYTAMCLQMDKLWVLQVKGGFCRNIAEGELGSHYG